MPISIVMFCFEGCLNVNNESYYYVALSTRQLTEGEATLNNPSGCPMAYVVAVVLLVNNVIMAQHITLHKMPFHNLDSQNCEWIQWFALRLGSWLLSIFSIIKHARL